MIVVKKEPKTDNKKGKVNQEEMEEVDTFKYLRESCAYGSMNEKVTHKLQNGKKV